MNGLFLLRRGKIVLQSAMWSCIVLLAGCRGDGLTTVSPEPLHRVSTALPKLSPDVAGGLPNTAIAFDRGELAEIVRNPRAPGGWLIRGARSHRAIGVTDGIPDAQGLQVVRLVPADAMTP
jgi:hypothetical protein